MTRRTKLSHADREKRAAKREARAARERTRAIILRSGGRYAQAGALYLRAVDAARKQAGSFEGRIVCDLCGTEQAFATADRELAPCVGPFDLGTCPSETAVTLEAFAEA